MKSKFDFGELGGILADSKKPDMVKIASDVSANNIPVADALDAVCRIADSLDEMGHADMADELSKCTQLIIRSKIVKAEEEKKEEKGEETEEVMSVTCPHCSKEFDVVVESEDGKCEVETKEEEKKEHGDDKGGEKEGQENEG